MNYFELALEFLGSLGLFIYGMNVLASGLQKSTGNRMNRVLEVLTKKRFMGVLLGTAVTAIIQSSSATTVMVVGFVNAGVMNLSQSIGVIMGANIGTTVTSWIVASIEWAKYLKPSTIAPLATVAGAFLLLFSNKKSHKQTGEIIVGLGILFLGMTRMPEALKPLAENDAIRNMFVTLGTNPLLGILTGVVVTGIIQSSSVSVGILQSLALAGLVPWNTAVYIIMGQNIGTCVTAILSSLGATRNAKAAAYMHLMFNVIGTVLFSAIAIVLFKLVIPDQGVKLINLTEISLVHTGFNLVTTLIMYPFANQLVKLGSFLAQTGKTTVSESEAVHLDDRVLGTPPFAIQSSIKEILRLAVMAGENLKLSLRALYGGEKDITAGVYERENHIDSLEEAITAYLVKICNTNISEAENTEVTSLFHTLSDIERIGDHAENLAELADAAHEGDIIFSEAARTELNTIIETTLSCYQNAISALESSDRNLAKTAISQESEVDSMKERFRNEHINRLQRNECNVRSGVIYLETLNNLERVTDHAKNIAETVLGQRIKG